MTSPQPTPAQVYADAVWESERLTPAQRLVALCYANHARGGDTAWVVTSRLMARTGIQSRGTACDAVKALVAAGWLTKVGAHSSHSQRIVYRLTVPDEAELPEPARPARARGRDGRYATKTGPQHGPVHNTDRSTDGTKTGPPRGHEPVHPMDETGPPNGPDSLKDSLSDSLHDSARAGVVRPFEAVGATPEEERIIKARITTGRQVRDLGAYLAAMHRSGDLAAMLATIRAEARAETVAVELEQLRRAAPCRHDYPGGDQPHPGTGELLCPKCRRFGAKPDAAPEAELPQAVTCPEHPPLPGGVDDSGQPNCAVCRGKETPRDVPVWWQDQPDRQERPASPALAPAVNATPPPTSPRRRAALTLIQGGA